MDYYGDPLAILTMILAVIIIFSILVSWMRKKKGIELSEDERIALDDGIVGYKQKLTLTNKRLIYSKEKGWLNATWDKTFEIPLENIEEAYVETTGVLVQSSTVKLRMKNGEVKDLDLKLSSGDTAGAFLAYDTGTDLAVRTKTVCDRWANAINLQLAKEGKNQSQIEMLEERIRQLEEKLKEKAT